MIKLIDNSLPIGLLRRATLVLEWSSRRLRILHRRLASRRKAFHYLRHHNLTHTWVGVEILRQHNELWRPISHWIDPAWVNIYAVASGIISPEYVPEDLYYGIIEPRLNLENGDTNNSIDKNSYDKSVCARLFPTTLVRNMACAYFDTDYRPLNLHTDQDLTDALQRTPELVVKPALASGGGRSVMIFKLGVDDRHYDREGRPLTLVFLQQQYGRDFVIQERLRQHAFMAQFNSSSVNTLRVLTYRSVADESIHILSIVLRVGGPGSLVDNVHAGGLAVGVDAGGSLNHFAVNILGDRFDHIHDVDLAQTLVIPKFEELKAAAIRLAGEFSYQRVLGLDLTLDDQMQVRALEVNSRILGINFLQMNNGPLFNDKLPEIIDYCRHA